VCRLPESGSKWNRRSFSRVSAAKKKPLLADGGYGFARFEKTTLKVSDFPENQNQVIFVRSIQTLNYA
jgi:hypothetical protein